MTIEESVVDADARARDVEAHTTDREHRSMLVSVMGSNAVVPVRDAQIPEGTPMSAGYVPGVPRLGVPAQLVSDASLGVRPTRTTGRATPQRRYWRGSAWERPSIRTWPVVRDRW
jgi:beta-glucosidase